MPEALSATIDHLEEIPQEVGVKGEISLLVDRAQRGSSGAQRQLAVHDEEGSLEAVARDVAERTAP